MTPYRLLPKDAALSEVLALIRRSFAYMDGRIDPPSSMHRLTLDSLCQGEVWALGTPIVACVVLTPQTDCLYLGKLAVDPAARRRGLGARLVALAEARAAELGLPCIRLQTRVELVENHCTFARLGFLRTGETAHPGYDRPTSVTMERRVACSPRGQQAKA